MNHHLRFASALPCTPAAWLSILATAFMPSCASVADSASAAAPPPPITPKPGIVTVATHFSTVPDGFHPAGSPGQPTLVEILTPEDGAGLLKRLARMKGAASTTIPHVDLKRKAGAKGKLNITREHVYASEYAPAVMNKTMEGHEGIFPVTPATPTAFETRDLGIRITYGINGLSGTMVDFDCQFRRTSLVGNLNYGKPITTSATDMFGRPVEVVVTENKMEMPVFGTDSSSSSVTIQSGHYLVLRGRRQSEPTPEDASFLPPPILPPPSANADWIAVIQVVVGPAS